MTAERLRHALAALPVTIATAVCRRDDAAIAGYPGGLRPRSVVTLTGDGARGDGEHVGWSTDSHDRFATHVASLPTGVASIAAWSEAMRRRVPEPYARAACETAAVALALTQAETSLAALAGQAPRRPRMVRSLAPGADPWPALARVAANELKLDADPGWTPATWRALAERTRVAVVDFKHRGDAATVRMAHDAFPDAWLEDPPRLAARGLESRVSLDASIVDVAVLARGAPPAAVNVKVPRMGGLLAALDAVAWCERHHVPVYFGGMWETGPGRALAQSLAALLAPDAPNDVAPLGRDVEPAHAWPVSQVMARSPRIKLRNAISGATFTTQK